MNPGLNHYKSIIKERLCSERGLKYRSKRPVEVEPVFGMIKGNRNYRKFLLRGPEKVEIEVGLLALAHNLAKMASKNQRKYLPSLVFIPFSLKGLKVIEYFVRKLKIKKAVSYIMRRPRLLNARPSAKARRGKTFV